MTRPRSLVIACAVLLTATRVTALYAQALPASAWNSESATAAAKANPDLAKALSKQIGGTPEQAAGAAGAMFGLAQTRLKPDQFSQIAKAVPGMDLLLKAAPAMSNAAAGGGAADPVSQLAGTVAGIPAVASAFGKMGIKPELAPKVASALTSYVSKSGGKNVGALLASVLK